MALFTIEAPDELSELIAQAGARLPELCLLSAEDELISKSRRTLSRISESLS